MYIFKKNYLSFNFEILDSMSNFLLFIFEFYGFDIRKFLRKTFFRSEVGGAKIQSIYIFKRKRDRLEVLKTM